ncbi:hypothetical protein ABT237_20975 [Streptomyces sp. NPDC001581]|uniref:hypothetical protein n=1 Tax=Streptomyces sp. NPDC001581 TaxID=3154386 RepID=UPI00332966D1
MADKREDQAPSEVMAGALVVDTRTDRVGIVMGNVGPYVQLRPPGGGTEWDVLPDDLRSAVVLDELRAKVSVVNAQGRRLR